MERVDITISERHITRALRRKACKNYRPSQACPTVLAVQDKLKNHSIRVGTTLVSLDKDERDSSTYFRLPEIACDFIRDFDAGSPVKPIKFTMEKLQNSVEYQLLRRE